MSANGLHRIRWTQVAVARVNRTAASQFARDGKRTLSDPMETGCRRKIPLDCRESVRERLGKSTAKYS